MTKVFASDFDGTLFFRNFVPPRNEDGTPEDFREHLRKAGSDRNLAGFDPEDIEAIRKFQKEGNLFGVVTGRAEPSLRDYLSRQIIPDFYVFSSGALIKDKDGNVISSSPMSAEDARWIFDHLDCVNWSLATNRRFFQSDPSFPLAHASLGPDQLDLDHLQDGEQIISLSMTLSSEDQAFAHLKSLENRPSVHGFANHSSLDLLAAGVSKKTGLETILSHYGVSKALSASIGDGMNDLPLLQDAKYGYTIAKAPQALKEEACRIVDSVHEAMDDFEAECAKASV